MTAVLLFLIVFGVAFAIGHMKGYDAGVLETEALQMLRGAFVERPMRNRAGWRRPG